MRTSPSTLRELRRQRGLTLAAVAVLADTDAAAISKIEAGQARATPPSIVKLARALGVDARRMARLCDAAWRDREERKPDPRSEDLRRVDIDAMAGRA
jgi:transcriptional regulator with XRE-family HTH domain